MSKDTNKNRSYTKEFKDSILKRLEQNEKISSLSMNYIYPNLRFTNELEHIIRRKKATQST